MLHAHAFEAALAAAAVVSLLGARTADAATIVTREELVLEPFNTCTGEGLSCTGTHMTVSSSNPDNAGGTHVHGVIRDVFTCVGQSGIEYSGHFVNVTGGNVVAGGTTHLMFLLQSVLASRGPEPTLVLYFLQRVTLDSNGEVTSEIVKTFSECPGST